MRQYRQPSTLDQDEDEATDNNDDNNDKQQEGKLKDLDDKTDNVRGSVTALKDKQEYLSADFDDFETNIRKTREKMKHLLNKHDTVHEKMQGGAGSGEDDGQHWEYFQQQNKLLNLAVSKLCQKEGINVEDLLNGDEHHWRSRRRQLSENEQELW